MRPRRHDDFVGAFQLQRAFGCDFHQFVAGEVGKVVECLHALFPEGHQHRRLEAVDRGQFVGNPEFDALAVVFLVANGEIGARTAAQLLGDVLFETFDVDQILHRDEGHVLDRRKTLGYQQVGDHVVDIEGVDKGLRADAEFLRAALAFLLLGEDVDVPPGQLRGESDVLSATADRKTKLFIGHDHLDAVGLFVEHHLGDLGGRQTIDDKGGGIPRPLDDVDLLALQLADHRLHARAAHADAGADRINAGIVGKHGDLGARAGVAGDRPDFDDAFVDLRHLLGEQLDHELRVGARKEHLRPARLFAHVDDVGAHPIAGVEVFARNGLFAAQQRLGTVEIDDDVAELDAFDQAVDHFADAVLELVVLAFALGFANLVHDHLFRGLRGDTAEIDRRQGIDQLIADLRTGLAALRRRHRQLGGFVFHLLDDLEVAGERNFTADAVDPDPNIVLLAVLGPSGLLDRLLHRLEHFLAVDPLVSGDGVRHLKQFGTRVNGIGFHRHLAHRSSVSVPTPCPAFASRSSVNTSFARRMSAYGSNTSVSSIRIRTASPSAPSNRPWYRRRPSTAKSISTLASKPANRSKSAKRTSGRSIPGELTSSVYAPAMGSSTSSTADTARLSAAQSSTTIDSPSVRSAMI